MTHSDPTTGYDFMKRCPDCRGFDCTELLEIEGAWWVECSCGYSIDGDDMELALIAFEDADRSGNGEYCQHCGCAYFKSYSWSSEAWGNIKEHRSQTCMDCGEER
jgi:hypothetical protein